MENQNKYNTVILGSSRPCRGINPQILDDSLKDFQTSTFNLASPATHNPEVYYLYEKLLGSIEPNRLKYAFIELQSLHPIANENLRTIRNYYWHNLKYLHFSFKYIFKSNIPFSSKLNLIKSYIISYVYKSVYGYKALVNNNLKQYKLLLGINKDGFCTLDELAKENGGNNIFRKRSISFQEDTTLLEERISIAHQAFAVKNYKPFINEVHLKKLNRLIKISQQKGVHLIFIIPPRRDEVNIYNELLAIKERLPSHHIIEIANPKKYPQLYQVEFTFDIGHFNRKGAKLYSKYLANELLKNIFYIKKRSDILHREHDLNGL